MAAEAQALRKELPALLATDYQKAVEKVRTALEAARQSNDEAKEAVLHLAMAECFLYGSDTPSAIGSATRARLVLTKLQDKTSEASVLLVLTDAYLQANEQYKARDAAKEALSKAEDSKDQGLIAKAWLATARARMRAEASGDPMEAAKKALDIYTSSKDKQGQGRAQLCIAQLRYARKQRTSAAEVAKASLVSFRDAGDTTGIVGALAVLVEALLANQKFGEATAVAEEQLELFKEQNNHEGRGRALMSLAKSMVAGDDTLKAVSRVTEIYRELQSKGEKRAENFAATAVIYVDLQSGSLQQAHDKAKSSLPAFRDMKDRRGEAMVYKVLANVCFQSGDYHMTVQNATRARMLYSQLGDMEEEEPIQKLINDSYTLLGEPGKAPFRAKAESALKQLSHAVENRQAVGVKAAMKTLEEVGAYGAEDLQKAIQPALLKDKSGTRSFIRKELGMDLGSGRGSEIATVCNALEMDFSEEGAKYGPGFRTLSLSAVRKMNDVVLASHGIATMSNPEIMEWELLNQLPDGIYQGAVHNHDIMRSKIPGV